MYVSYMENQPNIYKNAYGLRIDYLGPFTDFPIEGGSLKVLPLVSDVLGLHALCGDLLSELYNNADITLRLKV